MIVGGIATIPSREHTLKLVLDSIVPQVTTLFVALNGYTEVPDWIHKTYNSDGFIHVTTILNNNSKGDAMKFAMADIPDNLYFSFDDDLIYPENYCSYMLSKYKDHPKSIITLHGKVFSKPITSSHRGIKENYRCLNTVVGDHVVETGGTGVMMFNTNEVKVNLDMFNHPNMADIWMGKIAHEQNIPIVVVEHSAGWLQYIPQAKTIWGDHNREEDIYQAKVLNSYLK